MLFFMIFIAKRIALLSLLWQISQVSLHHSKVSFPQPCRKIERGVFKQIYHSLILCYAQTQYFY